MHGSHYYCDYQCYQVRPLLPTFALVLIIAKYYYQSSLRLLLLRLLLRLQRLPLPLLPAPQPFGPLVYTVRAIGFAASYCRGPQFAVATETVLNANDPNLREIKKLINGAAMAIAWR